MRESGNFDNRARDGLLRGVIPGANSLIYFTEEIVKGDGNCGFTSLGHDRDEVTNILLALADDENSRSELCAEIYEAFRYNSVKAPQMFEELYKAYEAPGLTEDAREKIHDVIEQYCKREAIYKYYVNHYRKELWLGYKSALLFAKTMGISVYVWRKDEKGTLTVIDSTVSEKKGQVIHMLMTQGYTHYNLLVEAEAPIQANNPNPAISKLNFLDPSNQSHLNFAKQIAALEAAQLRQIFVEPDNGYKKIIKGLGSSKERAIQEAQEEAVRGTDAQEKFELISGLSLSLFENLKLPVLNSELKRIVLAALEMLYVETNDKGLLLKIRAIEPKHRLINASESQSPRLNDTETVTANIDKLVSDINSDLPHTHGSQQTSEDTGKPEFKKPLPPKPTGSVFIGNKKLPEKPKNVENPVDKKDISGNSEPKGKDQNLLDFIEKVETPILNSVKEFGYTNFMKTPEVYSLINNINGHKIDFHKNGDIKSDNYLLSESLEKLANDLSDAMLVVAKAQLEIVKQFGMDVAFPKGVLILQIEPNGKLSKEEEDKTNRVKVLVEEKFKQGMHDPLFDSIRDKVFFHNDASPKPSQKEKDNLILSPSTSSIEKEVPKSTASPETLNDTPKSSKQTSSAPVKEFRKYIPPVYESEKSGKPHAIVAPLLHGKPGGINRGKGEDLRKQVLNKEHHRNMRSQNTRPHK